MIKVQVYQHLAPLGFHKTQFGPVHVFLVLLVRILQKWDKQRVKSVAKVEFVEEPPLPENEVGRDVE